MTPEQLLREKTRRALDAARASLARDDAETAANRAYYAAFYIATAYPQQVGQTPHTHKGLHLTWGLHARHLLPADLATFLTHAFQLRQRADYDALSMLDLQATGSLVDDAERFITAVESLFE